MENATKAIIMAGGILIGVILLSIIVIAFRQGGEFAKARDESIADLEIAKFNSQFVIYTGRENVTIHELLSLINTINEYKSRNDSISVIIYKDGTKITATNKSTQQQRLDMIGQLENELRNCDSKGYSCTGIEYNQYDGRVNCLMFTKNN